MIVASHGAPSSAVDRHNSSKPLAHPFPALGTTVPSRWHTRFQPLAQPFQAEETARNSIT